MNPLLGAVLFVILVPVLAGVVFMNSPKWFPRLMMVLGLWKPTRPALAIARLLEEDPSGWIRGHNKWVHTTTDISVWVGNGEEAVQYWGAGGGFDVEKRPPYADRVFLWRQIGEAVALDKASEHQRKQVQIIDAVNAALAEKGKTTD